MRIDKLRRDARLKITVVVTENRTTKRFTAAVHAYVSIRVQFQLLEWHE